MLLRTEPAHSTARCPVWAGRLGNTGSTRPRPPRQSEIALETMRYTIGHDYVMSRKLDSAGLSRVKAKATSSASTQAYIPCRNRGYGEIGLPKSSLADLLLDRRFSFISRRRSFH